MPKNRQVAAVAVAEAVRRDNYLLLEVPKVRRNPMTVEEAQVAKAGSTAAPKAAADTVAVHMAAAEIEVLLLVLVMTAEVGAAG